MGYGEIPGFALPVGGPIFGGAYTWRGLFSEFYRIRELTLGRV